MASVGWGDASLYPARADRLAIYVVSNGFHSGPIVPRAVLTETARKENRSAVLEMADRFSAYDWLELGWGDDAFYRAVPTVSSFDWKLGLRALFHPGNASVLHVVGLKGDPLHEYREATTVRLDLSPDGFARLVGALDGSFWRDREGRLQELGRGLYGPSLFYRAVGAFSVVNLCNHWTARVLSAAGVPVWSLLATIPAGLLLDLRLRAGATAVRSPLPAATEAP